MRNANDREGRGRRRAWGGAVGVAVVVALVALMGAPGCGAQEQPVEREPTLTVAVQPLAFPPLSDVVYRLTVRRADGEAVWSREVGSAAYGDGGGALSYVGPCDASEGANPHAVELVVVDLIGPGGEPLGADRWKNPAPPERPATLPATCVAGSDAGVTFSLTLMRAAEQGFFDVAVTFADIFCSAKADCRRDGGAPLELLFNPLTERRETTVVMGFTCTTGQRLDGAAEETWLHFTDVALECDEAAPIYFDPSQGAGQHGALGTQFFESAIYRGVQEQPGYDACYWNHAFGVNLAVAPRRCRLVAQATAGHVSFAPSGHTPTNTIWPYVRWQVDLTDADGALICDVHALDGSDGVVSTGYTPATGATFQHSWRCGGGAPVTSSLACGGAFADGGTAQVYPSPEGVSVAIGGQRSPQYRLPAGMTLDDSPDCCVNPCCATP